MERIVIPGLAQYRLPSTRVHQDAAVTVTLDPLGREAAAAVVTSFNGIKLRQLLKGHAQDVDQFERRQITRVLASAVSVQGLEGNLLQADKAAALVDGFVEENAALITKLPTDYFLSIQRKIDKAVQQGTRVEELAKQLRATYDFPTNRAKLIARDQVGKLYGQLNQTRQQAVGIKTYIWRTMGDEAVREGHADLEGSVQDWDNPPDTGEDEGANHPGEAIQCRCTAEPNLDELGLP
jgi:SPP1 gp7 family putative phage head morphogenesis protein